MQAPSGPPERAAIQAIKDFTAAFASGDGAMAWSMVSTRCKGKMSESNYLNVVAGAPSSNPGLKASNISIEIGGQSSKASYDPGGRLASLCRPVTDQECRLVEMGRLRLVGQTPPAMTRCCCAEREGFRERARR